VVREYFKSGVFGRERGKVVEAPEPQIEAMGLTFLAFTLTSFSNLVIIFTVLPLNFKKRKGRNFIESLLENS
jgi:hypothetical protein